MKLFSRLLITTSLLISFCLSTTTVFADAKTDYEFQYSKYRQNYIEYTVLKKDYLANPTLDNQQKAVLAAKQSIISRDLAKSSFAAFLYDRCQEKQTNYAPIKPTLDSLIIAKNFFLAQSEKSKSIVTPANLDQFTKEYLVEAVPHNRSFRTGVVACKISELVRIQTQSKNALDVILPKLATPFSTSIQARIDDIQILGNKINDAIDDFTEKLYSEEELVNIDNDYFFTNKNETIKKIQTLQLKWIDSLIDIDINYAHS